MILISHLGLALEVHRRKEWETRLIILCVEQHLQTWLNSSSVLGKWVCQSVKRWKMRCASSIYPWAASSSCRTHTSNFFIPKSMNCPRGVYFPLGWPPQPTKCSTCLFLPRWVSSLAKNWKWGPPTHFSWFGNQIIEIEQNCILT